MKPKKDTAPTTLEISLILGVVFALWTFFSNEDAKDEEREEAHYIEMVCDEAWKDYKQIEPDC